MENNALFTVRGILRDVLENPSLEIEESTLLADIPGLESMAYMTAVSLIETEYGIQFDFDDIAAFKTVGELLEKIGGEKS